MLVTEEEQTEVQDLRLHHINTIPPQGQTSQIVDVDPATHAQPAMTGMFPRPMEILNRANFYGYTPDGGTTPVRSDGLKDSPELRTAVIVSGITLTEGSRNLITRWH